MAKQTDLQTLLGGAKGAKEIPRPQVDPAPTPEQRRTNVALRADLHKALKRLSVDRDTTVQELLDEVVQGFLADPRNTGM